jgi:ArsR family transcriptional regulator
MSEKNCGAERIASVRDKMPQQETLYDLAELYKMFGDSTRVSILCVLLDGEMCVGDIAELLSMGQSAISHQLRLLRSSGLVRSRRDGKTVYYSLADSHVHDIFSLGLEHVTEKD